MRILLAIALALAAAANAATVTLSNGQSCQATQVVVTCQGATPAPAPGPTPAPPPPPPTPPAPSGCNPSAIIPTLAFGGLPREQRTVSGQIFAVEVIRFDHTGAIVFTQGQQPQMGSGTVTTEYSVSRCPGSMTAHAHPKCYRKNTSGGVNSNAITIFTKPTPYVRSQADISGDGCWAPATEGKWYVNVKWTWASCTWGTCGFSLQWAPGGYW